MSENLWEFFSKHPFWAVVILVFAILPVIGAVIHILFKAFGRQGIDQTPPGFEYGPNDKTSEKDTSTDDQEQPK